MNSPAAVASYRRRREIWVGVFVLAGLLALLAALFTLTDPATFRGRYHVNAVVDDAAGIRRGDPVQMRGVNIGRVRDFHITPEGVSIRLELDEDFPIPRDSHVALRAAGILGEMVAEIIPGISAYKLEDGHVLRGKTREGPLGRIGDVAKEASGALGRVQELLSRETVGNVQASAGELTELLRQLSSLAGELQGIAQNLGPSSAGLRRATAGPELANTVENLEGLTQRLTAVSKSLEQSAAAASILLGRINRGEGSLGKLARDETLYRNAVTAMANLDGAAQALTRLAEDIQKHPKRYINLSLF